MIRIAYFFVIVSLLFIPPLYADGTHPQGIKLDGTIGNTSKIELPGPNYNIRPEYGKQAGSNLFHSFEQFNIHKGESATFSGTDSVKNIISRVTGGSASWIDGKLASTIPNADMYFLNPFGVMFGSNASLDLGGSFHVSTADYLKMGDNERFYSKPLANEILSIAAPSAFGFLNDKPGSISAEGSFLSVPTGKTASFIGGDIFSTTTP
ncbi:MAG: filamentous hemagglutinin N-terminal domain-containing protein [Desulfobacteraceae bacterium]|nr:filamentous hemagglutinin N-terminal domain-containing protein [Desulfobacteraceae bacterium]